MVLGPCHPKRRDASQGRGSAARAATSASLQKPVSRRWRQSNPSSRPSASTTATRCRPPATRSWRASRPARRARSSGWRGRRTGGRAPRRPPRGGRGGRRAPGCRGNRPASVTRSMWTWSSPNAARAWPTVSVGGSVWATGRRRHRPCDRADRSGRGHRSGCRTSGLPSWRSYGGVPLGAGRRGRVVPSDLDPGPGQDGLRR